MFPSRTPNHGDRKPTMIIIHGTEVDDATARAIFLGQTEAQGSCHYYIDANGEIVQYLDETKRAWHAGQSFWSGITDINSMSIGIELEAISHSRKFDGAETVYTDAQYQSLISVIADLQTRFAIAPWHVLAHQDVSCTRPFDPVPAASLEDILATQPVAQQRKYDPGCNFDWRLLAENGIGAWHGLQPSTDDPEITDNTALAEFSRNMALYGYDMRQAGLEHGHEHAIRAFQTHFQPWNISGRPTRQSAEILTILLAAKMA